MWPAVGHLWFKIPKYISVVNKYTLRAKGVEADICFTFYTSVAVSNSSVFYGINHCNQSSHYTDFVTYCTCATTAPALKQLVLI